MATSIAHRASGVAMYVGSLVIAGWLLAAARGQTPYERFEALLLSPLGRVVLFAFTLAATYHLANGLRHLVWDLGYGFEPRRADRSGLFVFGFSGVATVVIWLLAYA